MQYLTNKKTKQTGEWKPHYGYEVYSFLTLYDDNFI